MKRTDIIKSPDYWTTKIQIDLYNCAEQFMKKHGKNRAQLAEYMGVSRGYVTQVLNGDYDHRLSKFVELSIAFGYIPCVQFTPIENMLKFVGDGSQRASASMNGWYIMDNYNRLQA